MNQSPIRLLITLIVSIFVSDVAVMVMLSFMPPLSTWGEAFFDSTMLIVLLSPLLYILMFRPLIMHINERCLAEEELKQQRERLEEVVAERTGELTKAVEELGREITQRKHSEMALRESQERFAGILEIADDAIIFFDDAQLITLFNHGAERIFGYRADEVLDQPLDMLLPERFVEAHRQHIKDFATSPVDARLMRDRGVIVGRRKDGTEFPAEGSISKLDTGDEKIFTTILRDISERIRTQENMERAYEELQQAYKTLDQAQATAVAAEKMAAMGRLMSGVSHEILNPLNVITMNLHMMLADTKTPPELADDLEVMETQADRIVKIAQNLLYFGRRRPPDQRQIDLSDMAKRTLGLLEHEFRLENIAVELEFAEELPKISADQDQLQQVVLNLLTNGRDAMPEGGRLSLNTRVVNTESGDLVELRVEDTGPGIPSDVLDKIFDPFFTTKPEGEGTGLGLSICQGIIEAHGGSIRAENVPGGGAAFVVSLRAQDEKRPSLGLQPSAKRNNRCP